jgi:hypothetical protein
MLSRNRLCVCLLATVAGSAFSGMARAQVSLYQTVRVVDTVVSNTNPALNNSDSFPDSENSIGINPQNPRELVVLGFADSFTSTTNGALFRSTDGGVTWTKNLSIPQPPGINGFINDQTLDWGRNNQLSFTFLTASNIVSVVTNNPAAPSSFAYRVNAGVTQLTNNLAPGSINNADQPWVLVNRDPALAARDNTYVAYDDFNNSDGIDGPDMRVAVSYGVTPLDFTVDRQVGNSTGGINPGLRMAKDPTSGAMYALWGRCTANCGGDPKTISYMLNRSTDGGQTWSLNGNGLGVSIATGLSSQPTPKFGTVNALLGGAHHAAVDPNNGAVYYAYGSQNASGADRFALRRLTFSGGNVNIGPEVIVTSLDSALPQVAVDTAGTVAVFFYSFDGIGPAPTNLPQFTAHLSLSANNGATFTDRTLLAFRSPVVDNGDPRQRILGDYQQMKAIGTTFYGVFTGNGAPLGRPFDNTDPIYFQVARNENTCVLATGTLNVGMNIGDRTQVTGSVASGGLLQLGSRATITGNVIVNANAFLRDNATVNGNVTLAGVLQTQNIFTITGTLLQNTPVTIPSLVTRTITPGTGTQNINPGATVTLNPGQFGNLNIYAGARVTLNPGTYNIAALDVEPDVILTVNSATTLNVQGQLIWSDRVRVQSTATRPLTLYTNDNEFRVGTDGVFNGFLIAPNATVDISSRENFQGCVGARNITMQPDVTLNSGGATLPMSATM